MNKKRNNIQMSPEDFLRYSNGEMTGKERNAFEKELQRDPFADEASEGFATLSATEASHDLRELEKRLHRRTSKRSYYAFYRIAAGVAIMVAISGVLLYTYKSKEEMKQPEIANVTRDEVNMKEIEIAKAEPIRKAAESKSSPRLPAGNYQDSPGSAPAPSPSISSADAITAAVKASEDEPVSEDVVDMKEKDKKEDVAEFKFAEAAAEQAISGKGAVEESSRDSRKISGVNASVAMKSKLAADHTYPAPVVGTDSFNIYLERNVRNPEKGIVTEQSVLISFKVQTDSTLTQIKILESPGRRWSEEAKRLIMEGPKWLPATINGIPVEESYTLRIWFR